MERVIIPAAKRNEASLPALLKIDDIMDAQLGKAFDGTLSLNPMQSSTFDVAFHSRYNMMVCAPVSSSCAWAIDAYCT
jgi:activating signal cointegrator complex subunit 3